MVALNCNVTSCVHNAENHCCKGDICVEGRCACNSCDTACGSFKERTGDSFRNSYEHPDRFISVECEAEHCKYNDNKICVADHINISKNNASNTQDTLCATFQSR